ncbi:n-acetyltransferase domain-containing protein [Trichonephila clavata]|uniref:N-acetyltransferase domain-containing protein n=1 Tax=Trichonephila clavata TaxID=2740835 RepID=A0A8X6J301_TRICU|nr:n-acetyltransferase domain-containing protein [Trichonephila clavata]
MREMKGKLKTKPNLAFKIRSMRLEDIPQIVELGRQERFQFPASSLKYWLTQDPDGMKIAVTESGEIIGSLFNIKNNERLYIGGVFCVQEKFRHLDVGRKLLQACDDHSEGINIGVNTDIHRVGPYMRRGVTVLETDWKSLEYETYTPVNPAILSDELPSGVEILAFQNSLLPAIYEYDYSLAGYERKSLIEASCHEENSRTLVAMKDGKCVGFGSIKLNIMEIGRIGPLYTDDPSVAEAMVKRLIPAMPEAKGFTTVTINTNLYANMVLEKLKIPIHSSLYRLYREERFHVDTKRVFAHFDIDFTPV